MRITLDTKIIGSEGLSLGEFLSLLIPYYKERYSVCYSSIIKKAFASSSKSNIKDLTLTCNQEDRVLRILAKCNPELDKCSVRDFKNLTSKLQELYPTGDKMYGIPWRGRTDEVEQRLRELFLDAGFDYTEEEAIDATKEYVASFNGHYTYMAALENFIEKRDEENNISSQLMTMIENKRENNE